MNDDSADNPAVMRTVGVEEEFLLIDGRLQRLAPLATEVLQIAAARGEACGRVGEVGQGALVHEFQQQQIEAYTSPHTSMPPLEAELRGWRKKASSAAALAGARVIASGTSPVPGELHHVRTSRYDRLAARFGFITEEQLTCGCHVHVSTTTAEEAVGVLDRIRVWLPTLLALTANSPFWHGNDTGYQSFRSQVQCRWPVSGPTDLFGSLSRYRATVEELLATGVILDEGMVYFEARLSRHYPTVEIRTSDVCLDVRDTVLVAALCRALVDTSAEEWSTSEPPPSIGTPALRLATWQAARWGLSGRLYDPVTSQPRPADEVVRRLLDHVGAALRRNRDQALVADAVDRLFDTGNGAARQRDLVTRTGSHAQFVNALAEATIN